MSRKKPVRTSAERFARTPVDPFIRRDKLELRGLLFSGIPRRLRALRGTSFRQDMRTFLDFQKPNQENISELSPFQDSFFYALSSYSSGMKKLMEQRRDPFFGETKPMIENAGAGMLLQGWILKFDELFRSKWHEKIDRLATFFDDNDRRMRDLRKLPLTFPHLARSGRGALVHILDNVLDDGIRSITECNDAHKRKELLSKLHRRVNSNLTMAEYSSVRSDSLREYPELSKIEKDYHNEHNAIAKKTEKRMNDSWIGGELSKIVVKPDVFNLKIDRNIDYQLNRLDRRRESADSISLTEKSEEYAKFKTLIDTVSRKIRRGRAEETIHLDDPAHALLVHGLILEFDRLTREYWEKKTKKISEIYGEYHKYNLTIIPELLTDTLSSNLPRVFSHLGRTKGLVKSVDELMDELIEHETELNQFNGSDTERWLRKKSIITNVSNRMENAIKTKTFLSFSGNNTEYGPLNSLFYNYGVERGLQDIPLILSKKVKRNIKAKFEELNHAYSMSTDSEYILQHYKGNLAEAKSDIDMMNLICSSSPGATRQFKQLAKVAGRGLTKMRKNEDPRNELAFLHAVGVFPKELMGLRS